jgi:transposase
VDLYRLDDPKQARARAEALIIDLHTCPIPVARLGRTLHALRTQLRAHFDHPEVSNGPTENLNLKIKNTKRIARGYRNFDHYRLRLLLNHGQIIRVASAAASPACSGSATRWSGTASG